MDDTNRNSGGSQEPVIETPSVWLGVKRRDQAQVLVGNKGGSKFLIRIERNNLGQFYCPTGTASHEEVAKAFTENTGFAVYAGNELVRVPEQPISQGFYHHDKGNGHVAVSCAVSADLLMAGSAHLKWLTRKDLREHMVHQRLTPELLQCLGLALML